MFKELSTHNWTKTSTRLSTASPADCVKKGHFGVYKHVRFRPGISASTTPEHGLATFSIRTVARLVKPSRTANRLSLPHSGNGATTLITQAGADYIEEACEHADLPEMLMKTDFLNVTFPELETVQRIEDLTKLGIGNRIYRDFIRFSE
jgi:hypothetical protein